MRRMDRSGYICKKISKSEVEIMTYAMNLNNIGFAELTQDEMMCVDGGNLFGDVCKVVTCATVSAVIGAIVSPYATPAGGYIAGVVSYEIISQAWDKAFK